jgi:hypothetical protein
LELKLALAKELALEPLSVRLSMLQLAHLSV